MKKTAVLLLFCVALLQAQNKTATPPPPTFTPTVGAPELHLEGDNHTEILRSLYGYAQDGRYERQIDQVVKSAHDWVAARTAGAKPGEKLAAIFDIDETAISNLPNMLNCGFCSTAVQARLFQGVRIPGIPQVRELFNFAKSKGVAVIFVTGRYESGRTQTVSDLEGAGYFGYDELLMRPSANSAPASIMKAALRESVERKGYKIILNIGDQLSDLMGGYSERTYKLPDPFYFVE